MEDNQNTSGNVNESNNDSTSNETTTATMEANQGAGTADNDSNNDSASNETSTNAAKNNNDDGARGNTTTNNDEEKIQDGSNYKGDDDIETNVESRDGSNYKGDDDIETNVESGTGNIEPHENGSNNARLGDGKEASSVEEEKKYFITEEVNLYASWLAILSTLTPTVRDRKRVLQLRGMKINHGVLQKNTVVMIQNNGLGNKARFVRLPEPSLANDVPHFILSAQVRGNNIHQKNEAGNATTEPLIRVYEPIGTKCPNQ